MLPLTVLVQHSDGSPLSMEQHPTPAKPEACPLTTSFPTFCFLTTLPPLQPFCPSLTTPRLLPPQAFTLWPPPLSILACRPRLRGRSLLPFLPMGSLFHHPGFTWFYFLCSSCHNWGGSLFYCSPSAQASLEGGASWGVEVGRGKWESGVSILFAAEFLFPTTAAAT